jgi:hypothetical protein
MKSGVVLYAMPKILPRISLAIVVVLVFTWFTAAWAENLILSHFTSTHLVSPNSLK